jgi:hypothetical protein
MASENTTISVQLIEHDVAQVLKQTNPSRVVRQDPGVEHVKIREDDVTAIPNRGAGIARSIAVIGKNAKLTSI